MASYYWLLCLLKIIKPESLNRCFIRWVESIVNQCADYLLSVKDNQPTLKEEIARFVQDDQLRKTMDYHETHEKNSGRIERRSAFSTSDIEWLFGSEDWTKLACIGAINTRFTAKTGTSDEWRYYISSRSLSAEELLRLARMEWSVETMHWLLDVHFAEDFCRVEDENVQQTRNMLRKSALNIIKLHKAKTESKRPFSKIMLDCLLDCCSILPLLQN
ncbi:MAG: ISAs1 family transposase [Firmicutes bacterium]|nr:ISAs1 family transposase [Bacillota bacterium]